MNYLVKNGYAKPATDSNIQKLNTENKIKFEEEQLFIKEAFDTNWVAPLGPNVNALEKELADVNEWIANFNTEFVKELVEKSVATMIFVGISDTGYIFYDMPDSWDDIQFSTTGLDIDVATMPEYGHLVLSY